MNDHMKEHLRKAEIEARWRTVGYKQGYNKALEVAMKLVKETCCDSAELEDILCGLESRKHQI